MRLNHSTSVSCAILLALALPLVAENRALLIGVGAYRPEIGQLPGIEKDVALAREFAGLIGFRPDQIKELFNEQATLANIKTGFNTWLKEAKAGDKVFVYFSGHGSHVEDTNGDEADKQDELLVTYDTAVVNGKLVNYLLDDEVDEMVSSLESTSILIAFDSCHSGTAARSLGVIEKRAHFEGEPKKSAASRAVGAPRWVLLSASTDKETAGASRVGSYLTTSLVQVARAHKQAGQPFVLSAAREEIERAVVRLKADQHPGLDGNEALRNQDWFRDAASSSTPGAPPSRPPASAPPSRPSPPRPSPPSGLTGELADKLEQVYNQRVGELKCSLSGGPTLKAGSQVVVSCDLPRPGYLYVFNLGAGDREVSVLLPNKWVPSAQVEAGPITLPSTQRTFRVSANLPPGMNDQAGRVYALLTASELKSVPADFSGGFGSLSSAGERALQAEGPEGYEAARIEFRIVR